MSAKGRKTDPLSKKIPLNPKYKDVKATVDTGASMSKYMAKIEDIRTNYRFRPNELFKRMKMTTYVQLVLQVADLNFEDPDFLGGGDMSNRPLTCDTDAELSKFNNGSPAPSIALTENDYGAPPDTARSTLESVITGVGEFDLDQPPAAPINNFVNDTCPYLLLDIRDKDEYDQCHIKTAKSFPIALLSRSCNYETKEMLTYKNQTGKIILLYDNEERLAPKAATTLVERGYDNLFLLSGGIKVGYKLFREGLISGTVPHSLTQNKKPPKEIRMATQAPFTMEDLENLAMCLDNALQDHSIGSTSRLSKASSRMSGTSSQLSKAPSTARSTISQVSQASTVTGRPAFKP